MLSKLKAKLRLQKTVAYLFCGFLGVPRPILKEQTSNFCFFLLPPGRRMRCAPHSSRPTVSAPKPIGAAAHIHGDPWTLGTGVIRYLNRHLFLLKCNRSNLWAHFIFISNPINLGRQIQGKE